MKIKDVISSMESLGYRHNDAYWGCYENKQGAKRFKSKYLIFCNRPTLEAEEFVVIIYDLKGKDKGIIKNVFITVNNPEAPAINIRGSFKNLRVDTHNRKLIYHSKAEHVELDL